eukprot:5079883-Prymnesium_polylepis.1
MLHFPTELVVFLLDATLPPLACAFVLVRSYHFPFMLVASSRAAPRGALQKRPPSTRRDSDAPSPHAPPPPLPSWRRRGLDFVLAYVRCLLLGDSPTYSDISSIYLCKAYLLGWSALALLALTCAQARYFTFALPQLLLVRFQLEDGWSVRFALMTAQVADWPALSRRLACH